VGPVVGGGVVGGGVVPGAPPADASATRCARNVVPSGATGVPAVLVTSEYASLPPSCRSEQSVAAVVNTYQPHAT